MVARKLKRILKTMTGKPKAPAKDKSKERSLDLTAKQIAKLEKTLGHEFYDKSLLVEALTHPSFLLNTKSPLQNNQRLEFLGDAVIQLVLTHELFHNFPAEREGKLTNLRSGYARGDYMARIARQLDLDKYLLLKPKDRAAGIANQDSALGDAFEALIGALYLDAGWDVTQEIVLDLYPELHKAAEKKGVIANPKGRLQELVQPLYGNHALRYETTAVIGDPHNREFVVTVFIKDKPCGVGQGKAKKDASEKAALEAIASWKA